MSGLIADAKTLIDKARVEAQVFFFIKNYYILFYFIKLYNFNLFQFK